MHNLSDPEAARIVILNELDVILEMARITAETAFPKATIMEFSDPVKALESLQKEPPDLFMTDWCRKPPGGAELLGKLGMLNAKYPILVVSPFVKPDHVAKARSQELEITLVPTPFKLGSMSYLIRSKVAAYRASQLPWLSPITSKPASAGHFKTSHLGGRFLLGFRGLMTSFQRSAAGSAPPVMPERSEADAPPRRGLVARLTPGGLTGRAWCRVERVMRWPSLRRV